ncbi:hypothetical protein QJS10_CPA16g00413 [Acorus calamus]|uniref:Uncharacterized protein n=1 Tax=Acorus calamus TaxID=4465 RepID=A0AAV9D118_ACOCL|nr:hypothetical protein QJS10_CPA16g00413 [Acorus calamus]
MSQANNGADLDASASGISSSGSKRKRSFTHVTVHVELAIFGATWTNVRDNKKGNVSQEALQTLNLDHTGVRIKVEELRDIHQLKDCLRKTKGMTDQLALTRPL